MIIEVDTQLMAMPEQINLNQLVFLSMVLGKNQKIDQNVQKIVSLISDDEISYLINQNLITSTTRGSSITYHPTDKLKAILEPPKQFFDLFYEMYPLYVMRPDGSKAYLRANVHKCRHLYNTYVGNSKSMAQHINDCLQHEIDKKMREGKISYMKTMWRWLVDHQWEESEIEMTEPTEKVNAYGTELI